MKKQLLLLSVTVIMFTMFSCNNNNAEKTNDVALKQLPDNENVNKTDNKISSTEVAAAFSKPERINTKEFIDKIFDFKNNNQWNFKGNEPCVVDFYADWCRPCKIVAPVYESLAKDYEGKVRFYKINTDFEQELAAYFGINSIPTFMFCPTQGNPELYAGALQKEDFNKIINRLFADNLR